MLIAILSMLTCRADLAQAATSCPLVLAGDFKVAYVHQRTPIIGIKIGGKTFNMMVDSGSFVSAVTDTAWHLLGNPAYRNIAGTYGTGIGGYAQFNTVIAQDVDTGRVVTRDQDFIVGETSILMSEGKPVADGVLGYDFLQNFDIAFDLPDDRISLYLFQRNCDAPEAPWAGDFDVEPMTMKRHQTLPTVPYSVDDKILAGMIDSGAGVTLLSKSSLDQTGITPLSAPADLAGKLIGIGPGSPTAHFEKFASVTVGAEQFNNAWVAVAQVPLRDVADAVIGEDYLRTHRVFMSNSTRTVLFGLFVTGRPAGQ